MNAVERIKTICKERKIPISKLEKDCGFSNGYIGQLRKGTMQNDRMMIVSEYLGISIEELTTGEKPEIPMIAWTPEHLEVVELFDKLNKEQKTAILTMMRTLALS